MEVDEAEGEAEEKEDGSSRLSELSASESEDSGSEAAPSEPEPESDSDADVPKRKQARASKSPVRAPAPATKSKSPARVLDSKSTAKEAPVAKEGEGLMGPPAQAKRPSVDVKRPSFDKRRSSGPTTPATPAAPGELPKARQYVLAQLAKVIQPLFGDKMDAAAAEKYGCEVEASLFTHFKESVKGKETAGNRYK